MANLGENIDIEDGGEDFVPPVYVLEADGRCLYPDDLARLPLSDGTWSALLDRLGEAGEAPCQVDGRAALASRLPQGQVLVRVASGRPDRIDALTGLATRSAFEAALRTLATDPEAMASSAVLLLDLDRFKQVNDTFGHPLGDELLKAVARRMSRVVRGGDMVARLGGDEFAVIQRAGGQPDAAIGLAERVIETISRPYLLSSTSVNVGVSVGIALPASLGAAPERIFKCADLAMYEAKRAGRSCWRFFDAELEHRAAFRHRRETELRQAIPRAQFDLVYLPQVDIATRALTGFEALLRWNHPEEGVLAPSAFLRVAEEAGLAADIARWTLNRACRAAAAWPDRLSIAVNLSRAQLILPEILDILDRALAASGIPPGRLQIEVQEASLGDADGLDEVISGIRARGIRVSIDDFGLGYFRVRYLRQVRIDAIKIAPDLTRGLAGDRVSLALMRAIRDVSEAIGLGVVAEGVENEADLDALARTGFTAAQGFLFSEPLGLDEATRVAHGGETPGTAQ